MKYFVLFIAFLWWGVSQAFAQHEMSADTTISFSGLKEYGDFLIDMSLMNVHQAPKLTDFKLEVPDASKDFSQLFRLNPDVTYSQGLSNMFSRSPFGSYYGTSYGLFDPWSRTDNLQMSSFRLKNGMRINTYGEYNKDGYKVPNPSALPWERNNFKGAFELKSADGKFGFRVEVEQGRKTPF